MRRPTAPQGERGAFSPIIRVITIYHPDETMVVPVMSLKTFTDEAEAVS